MIDWDRPKGKICGVPPVPGARYEQDGKFFRVDGTEVPRNVKAPVVEKEDPASREPEQKPQTDFVYTPPTEPDPKPEIPADDQKQQIQKLVDDGKTHTEIGKELGITRQKVTRILCS